jgi:uncharacterized membrane protein
MNASRKIQLLAVAVIANSAAALALISATDAQAAACGARYDCTSLNCHNPFWAQSACFTNLPSNCSYTTPLACYDGGSMSCPFMVLCQDQ